MEESYTHLILTEQILLVLPLMDTPFGVGLISKTDRELARIKQPLRQIVECFSRSVILNKQSREIQRIFLEIEHYSTHSTLLMISTHLMRQPSSAFPTQKSLTTYSTRHSINHSEICPKELITALTTTWAQ